LVALGKADPSLIGPRTAPTVRLNEGV
jgi:hypothetical protein